MQNRIAIITGWLISTLIIGWMIISVAGHAHAETRQAPDTPSNDADLDATFGNAGIVTMSIPGSFVQIEPAGNGKVLALINKSRDQNDLNSKSSFQLMRFNNDGSLDQSFGQNGTLPTRNFDPNTCLQSWIGPHTFWLQPDGRVLLFYDCGALERILFNGQRDESFGTGGLITNLVSGLYGDKALASAPDGKFYLGSQGGPWKSWRVKRFHADGSIDTSFATSGTLGDCPDCSPFNTLSSVYTERLQGILTLSNGKLVIGHSLSLSLPYGGGYFTCYVDVYLPNGVDNIRIFTSSNTCFYGSYDGDQLLLAGPCDKCTTRLNLDGSVDESVGQNGVVSSTMGLNIQPRQHDGNVLCRSSYTEACNQVFPTLPVTNVTIARADDLGNPDLSFGNAGVATFVFSTTTQPNSPDVVIYESYVTDMKLEIDGRILVASVIQVPDPCPDPSMCSLTATSYPVLMRLNGHAVSINNIFFSLINRTLTPAP